MPKGFLLHRYKKLLVSGESGESILPTDVTDLRVRHYSDDDRCSESSASSDPGQLIINTEPLIVDDIRSHIHQHHDQERDPYMEYRDHFEYDQMVPVYDDAPQEEPLALTVKRRASPDHHHSSDVTKRSYPGPLKKRLHFFLTQQSTSSSSTVDVESVDSVRSDTPPPVVTPKKHRSHKKLPFDEHKSSPISGTVIREMTDEDLIGDVAPIRCGDIDPALNVVVVTEEARAELAKIENKIGDYICRLCKHFFKDAFGLAEHRCSCIVHVEYRCPECDKVFNCPANLASHRRWHKPRGNATSSSSPISSPTCSDDPEAAYSGPFLECNVCGKKFRRRAYLKKHLQSHGNAAAANASKETELHLSPASSRTPVSSPGMLTSPSHFPFHTMIHQSSPGPSYSLPPEMMQMIPSTSTSVIPHHDAYYQQRALVT